LANKLDWLDKHLALIRYRTVSEAAEKENYKIRPDMAEFFVGADGVEETVFKLAKAGKHKEACELMAYIAHKRAGLWWGYRCVVSLIAELLINPATDRDIDGIAASFETTVPDFAKVEPPKPSPEGKAAMEAQFNDIKARYQKLRAAIDPEAMKYAEDAVNVMNERFKEVHGMYPMDLIEKLIEKIPEDPYPIDPNSPVFKAADELKAKLQTVRKETIDTIKAVIPPKAPEHEKKLRDNALQAVYRWIAAPNDENSKACMDIGNECPDTPAGLLALSAFWAFGDLTPGGNQVVPTPPGLAANGLNQVLLMCALHKGGTRKLKERYELYFNLGVNVLGGKDNWEESLANGSPPHCNMPADEHSPEPRKADNDSPAYRRWNAGNGS
jgi:hypothetical protein